MTERQGLDWFATQFGTCSHGAIKNYCPACLGEEREARQQARQKPGTDGGDLGAEKQKSARLAVTVEEQATEIVRLRKLVAAARAQARPRRWFSRG